MDRPPFTAFHRPVIRAGVMNPDDPTPLSDWTTSWTEARNTLLNAGLAFYAFGLLVISSAATIEMETRYGK
jgi:hypothetical protein